ncbi:MAG: formate--tetrahydrofolate ligase [bacterium]|nr:formate--tetrahydrofolate ligase [bacterium]
MGNTKPITDVAASLDISPDHLIPYGYDKAKVQLAARDSGRPPGRLILVSAITPTDAGEGKTTTSIGLAQGFAKIGQKVCLALREPSLGPVFGMKGGATGGGRAILEPRVDINLHFNGDFHAITSANNLLAALLDNHLHHDNSLRIEQRRIAWRRVIDLNDRALRHVVIGLGGPGEGLPREGGFDITPASEVMATLCLAEDEDDLRQRLGRTLVALDRDRKPVTATDLNAVGAMMVLLKDALRPNLVQTGEGVPAFVHGGPFANIAHGCNSVIATKMAMAHADWTITEAGFGFDLGAEKFFDIKCSYAGLDTAAVVLVATVRALKRHGGVLKKKLGQTDPAAVERGLVNLHKHIENIRHFGESPVVTLNRFATDSDDEIRVVREACEGLAVPFAVCDGFERGGEGATELAELVMAQAETEPNPFRPLYDWEEPVKAKMNKIASLIYGARGVLWTKGAERDLRLVRRLGYNHLPICVAKTPVSLSDDPKLLGRPTDFETTVRGLIVSAGAGFLVALLGDIMRMPGLRAKPQAEHMDLVDGEVIGLV